jgi:hypothetical protein
LPFPRPNAKPQTRLGPSAAAKRLVTTRRTLFLLRLLVFLPQRQLCFRPAILSSDAGTT